MIRFKLHPKADTRRSSAVALIKMLLANKSPGILPEHVRELVDTLLWKITEADGKHNTRYKTSGALECSDKSRLRHEHVYQRSKMIEMLLSAEPDDVDTIVNDAVGCLVTVEEHSFLNKFHDEYGWERYRKAGLQVFDTGTQERKV